MHALDPQAVFSVVDLTGVLVNAILGGAIARALKLDAVGFMVLAVLSGLGGGMIRDVLLQEGKPVALTDPAYLSTALIGTLIAFLLSFEGTWANRVLVVADSLSLGCWAATGASKALGAGVGWIPAIMLGLITAVGGGAVRDVAVGRVPAIFGGNTLYASGALLASAEMVVLWELGLPNWGMAVGIISAAGLTVVARRRGWKLPGQGGWDVRQVGRQLTERARPRIHIHRRAADERRSKDLAERREESRAEDRAASRAAARSRGGRARGGKRRRSDSTQPQTGAIPRITAPAKRRTGGSSGDSGSARREGRG